MMRSSIAFARRYNLIGMIAGAFVLTVGYLAAPSSVNGATSVKTPAYGTINGSVHDSKGNPVAGAVISVVRAGASAVVKELRSSGDGSFIAKIAPGKYNLSAAAAGFDAVAFNDVDVRRSQQLYYRFNLTPLGAGRTLPERRSDRDSAKWRLRSSQSRRSILQVTEDPSGSTTVANTIDADDQATADSDATPDDSDIPVIETHRRARTQGLIETYFNSSSNSRLANYSGLNFALFQPINDRLDLLFTGQWASNQVGSRRLDATARFRVNPRHRASLSMGAIQLGQQFLPPDATNSLGQVSVRAVDEWVVRDGVVLVMGLDYARFTGLGSAMSVSPRFGVQMDANANTRIKLSFAPAGHENETEYVGGFEGNGAAFRNPDGQAIALVDGQAVLERSHRLEFGVERILDDASSIEVTGFFDTFSGRGVGLMAAPLSAFEGPEAGALERTAQQDGNARGVRVVYSRRISHIFSASAGYSIGRGQKLSPEGIEDPADLFENGYFQTAAAQFSADLDTGTRIRTVFRFSPGATVFAIDPFAGRLAVYDPSLSILVTQELPTFGLPVRAEAILNARNILDYQSAAADGTTRLSLNANRRLLRGGILVRF